MTELERVFEICHGYRRCFTQCNALPTLVEPVKGSETMKGDGVKSAEPDYSTRDCAMAARHIEHGLNNGTRAVPPLGLLRKACGI